VGTKAESDRTKQLWGTNAQILKVEIIIIITQLKNLKERMLKDFYHKQMIECSMRYI
jgi:hypothetical protein